MTETEYGEHQPSSMAEKSAIADTDYSLGRMSEPRLDPDVLPSFVSEGLEEKTFTQRQLAWRKFKRHKVALVAAIVLTIIVVLCLLAPWIAPYDYRVQDTSNTLQSPNWDHLMGTDTLGRDVFSRLLWGGRVSILVGIATALIVGLVGITVGLLSGYLGGWTDAVLMRFTDTMLALPFLIIAILAVRIWGASIRNIVLILAFTAWMALARILRGQVLSLKEREFVEAARALGATGRRIMVRHLLPNLVGIITVNLTLVVAVAILGEATLSFLGAGITEPTPTWGNMLEKNKGFLLTESYLVLFPAAAIVITVLCINFVGDGLRDALDPTQRKT